MKTIPRYVIDIGASYIEQYKEIVKAHKELFPKIVEITHKLLLNKKKSILILL